MMRVTLVLLVLGLTTTLATGDVSRSVWSERGSVLVNGSFEEDRLSHAWSVRRNFLDVTTHPHLPHFKFVRKAPVHGKQSLELDLHARATVIMSAIPAHKRARQFRIEGWIRASRDFKGEIAIFDDEIRSITFDMKIISGPNTRRIKPSTSWRRFSFDLPGPSFDLTFVIAGRGKLWFDAITAKPYP